MYDRPRHNFNRSIRKMETYLSSPMVKSFVAGSLSGTCSTIIFQPLDLVKTRIQSPVAAGSKSIGLISVVGNIIRNEKFHGMWKGLTPSLSRTVPGIGVYFSSLHWLRTHYGTADPSPYESVLVGALARAFSGISMLPFTVVKTRFESGCFKYNGVIQALGSIYKLEGTKGLYSGLSATLLRDAPFSGIYLMFYTQAKKIARDTPVFSNMNMPLLHFSCGIVAGCLASIVTQPPDVIKTHMQLYPDRYPRVSSVVAHIYQTDGMCGFLRGVLPRTLRRSLMAAMAWTVYEQVMSAMKLK